MGYTTSFEGQVEFDKPISNELVQEINIFCDKRHCESEDYPGVNTTPDYAPGLWCDWVCTETGLEWNGSEKSYHMAEWLEVLINKFLKPKGVVCNGFVEAYGEEAGDHWAIEVIDNEVQTKYPKITW